MAGITVNRTCLVREEVYTGSNPIGYTVRRNGIIYQISYYPFEVNLLSGIANDAINDIMNGTPVKSVKVLELLNKYKTSIILERLTSCCQNKKTVSKALAYLDRKEQIKVLECPRFETRGRKPKLSNIQLGVTYTGVTYTGEPFNPTEYAVEYKQHLSNTRVLGILV